MIEGRQKLKWKPHAAMYEKPTAFAFTLEHADTVQTHIHGGGLAGPIVTKQWSDVSLIEGDVQVFNGCTVAIELGETIEANAHWETSVILSSLGGSALSCKRHADRCNTRMD